MARGIENDVKVREEVTYFGHEFSLHQGFATGKGNAALVGAENLRLAVQSGRQLRGSVLAPHNPIACLCPHGLRLGRLAFGVVAPGTAERASLQEYRRTNARAVVDSEFPDIKDVTRSHDPFLFYSASLTQVVDAAEPLVIPLPLSIIWTSLTSPH